jgi:hypothetical protein
MTFSIRFTLVLITLVTLVFGAAGPSRADTTVLYDGSLNSTPDQQGWLYITNPGSSAVHSANEGGTTLNTTAKTNNQAGYFSYSHPLMPELNRSTGFTISFRVKVLSESHGNNSDRAGFSVIVITHYLKGLELGFWSNEIWAQADLFTHAEGTNFDTTESLTGYDLAIWGNNYRLSAGGLTILTGPLRDYSSFGPPYNIPDFLFFGDDTTSASASIKLASIACIDRVENVIGDINGSLRVGLDDAILALQVSGGLRPAGMISPAGLSDVDVNGDGRIGSEESIYILEKVAGLRE